jgi:hypothetical protein
LQLHLSRVIVLFESDLVEVVDTCGDMLFVGKGLLENLKGGTEVRGGSADFLQDPAD